MTEAQAERIANVVLGIAAAGVAVYVLMDPARRRAAWRLARFGISAAASWTIAEGRQAWTESGPRPATSPRQSQRI